MEQEYSTLVLFISHTRLLNILLIGVSFSHPYRHAPAFSSRKYVDLFKIQNISKHGRLTYSIVYIQVLLNLTIIDLLITIEAKRPVTNLVNI